MGRVELKKAHNNNLQAKAVTESSKVLDVSEIVGAIRDMKTGMDLSPLIDEIRGVKNEVKNINTNGDNVKHEFGEQLWKVQTDVDTIKTGISNFSTSCSGHQRRKEPRMEHPN